MAVASGNTPAFLTALVDVASDAATGPQPITLRTADGQNPTQLDNAFTINPGPVPNGNTPAASFGQGAGSEPAAPTHISITVKGSGFGRVKGLDAMQEYTTVKNIQIAYAATESAT